MRKVLLALAIVAISFGCGGSDKGENTTPTGEKSLFVRLGGKESITLVVDDFVANVAADKRINMFFEKTDIPKLKMHLVDQICQATGGPCQYTGRTMVEAHTGMNITDDQFNALVEDLVAALDKHQVPEQEKNELLTALAAMKGDIVGK